MGLYREMKKRLPLRYIKKGLIELRTHNLESYVNNKELYEGTTDQDALISMGRYLGVAEGLQIALNYLDNFDLSTLSPRKQIEDLIAELSDSE